MRITMIPIAALALSAAEPTIDTERLARIAPRMKAFADQRRVAGTVTLVGHRGRVVHHEAVGVQDSESAKPMSRDSIFQIMSMTKPMVATAIMVLADEGKLAISDAVEKHLPEFRGQQVRNGLELRKPSRAITIRDLLTHTSGLPGNPPAGIAELPQTMDKTLAQAVLIYSQLPLEFDPGTKWLYSNNGIATLGRIVETVSGQPFETFMDERLWKPLGMRDTFVFPPDDRKPRIAAVHSGTGPALVHADASRTLGGEALNYRRGARYPAPEWGAYSTAADLFAFYEMTRNGGTHNGRRVLSQAGVDVMVSLHTGEIPVASPGSGFGLGWEVIRDNMGTLNYLSKGSWGHGGAFGTHGWIDARKGLVGVFLVQGGPGAGDAKSAFMKLAAAAVN